MPILECQQARTDHNGNVEHEQRNPQARSLLVLLPGWLKVGCGVHRAPKKVRTDSMPGEAVRGIPKLGSPANVQNGYLRLRLYHFPAVL